MNHTNTGYLFTELLLEVFRFNGALLADGDRITADIGLTSARWQVMGTIDDRSLAVPHIAREMGLTRQGVQKTVNILGKEGLIELQNNPHHKTAKLVQITPKGRQRLDLASKIQMEWANTLTQTLNIDDLKTAYNVIQILRIKIEEG
ncbi:MAG: MarR family transcriptional regulator, partial [Magnetovibrio sp.]|nr:MarR family transcriptional regulator [Magnetovibrio sp.]